MFAVKCIGRGASTAISRGRRMLGCAEEDAAAQDDG